MPDKECLDDKASEALMKLYENGTFLIGEVGGESEPMLAKLSAASLPGIPMWAGVHTTETECEE